MLVSLDKRKAFPLSGLWLGLSALGIAVLLVGCTENTIKVGTTSPQASPTAVLTPLPSPTTKPSVGKTAGTASYSGEVRAKEQVTLVAKMPERVKEIKGDVGDPVKKGDLLIVLEHQVVDAQVKQAEAALAAAESTLGRVEAGPRAQQMAAAEANLKGAQAQLAQLLAGPTKEQIEIAETQVRLAKNQLFSIQTQADAYLGSQTVVRGLIIFTQDMKEAQAGIAWEQVKLAEAQLAALKAPPQPEKVAQLQSTVAAAEQQLELAKAPYTEHDLKAARAQVAQAGAALQSAKGGQEEAYLHSPIDGWIASKGLSVGAMASAATPILTLVSSEVQVVIAVEEEAMNQFKVRQAVSIAVTAYPDRPFKGTVRAIGPAANPVSRTFDVFITPSGADGLLKPGMFATVSPLQ